MNELETERRMTQVENRAKSNTHRLDKLEPIVEEIHTMSKTIQNKLLSVDYSKFVPYLIKMVQMQNEKIDAQQQQINNLINKSE